MMPFAPFDGSAAVRPISPTSRRHTPVRRLLCALLPACLLAGVARLPAQQTAAARVALGDSFREVAATGTADAHHAQLVRELTADEAGASSRVSLTLRMRNFKELESRVAAGETIPRADMAARYLPDETEPARRSASSSTPCRSTAT